MIKRVFFSLFIFTISLIPFSFIPKISLAGAPEQEQLIRIGVIPDTEEVLIQSSSPFFIKNKETEEIIYEGNNEEITILLHSTALIETNYLLQA